MYCLSNKEIEKYYKGEPEGASSWVTKDFKPSFTRKEDSIVESDVLFEELNQPTVDGDIENSYKKQKSVKVVKKPISRKKAPENEIINMYLEGERFICPRGYIYVEYKNYREYDHILVVLLRGDYLFKGYNIHHVDQNKHNNNPDNLLVMSWKDHFKLHHKLKRNKKYIL